MDEVSGGRIPLRAECWREGDVWRFAAPPSAVLALPKIARSWLIPLAGGQPCESMTGLSPAGQYAYRPPAPHPAEFRPVDRMALHRLALSKMMPARVRPPSLVLGGEATCFMADAEWAAEVRADPFLSALASD